MNGTHHIFDRWGGVYSCYRYSGMLQIFIHFTKLDRVASTFLILSEKDKALSKTAFKELPRKSPLTSLLRELLKMNLHNIAFLSFFFFFAVAIVESEKQWVQKEVGFILDFLSHIRRICTDAQMAIICGGIVRRLKFLKIVSDAGDTPLCKAQDYWPTCASV